MEWAGERLALKLIHGAVVRFERFIFQLIQKELTKLDKAITVLRELAGTSFDPKRTHEDAHPIRHGSQKDRKSSEGEVGEGEVGKGSQELTIESRII
jgi:hypothetical protein